MFSKERYKGNKRCACGNTANWVIGRQTTKNRANLKGSPWYICNDCTDKSYIKKEPPKESAF